MATAPAFNRGDKPAPIQPTTQYTGPQDDPQAASAWLLQQPWFQQALQQWGVGGSQGQYFTPDQAAVMSQAARQAGVNLDDHYIASPQGFKWDEISSWPYILAGAGLAAGGLAGGLAAGAGGGAGAGTSATGALASTSLVPAMGTLPAGLAGGSAGIDAALAGAAAAGGTAVPIAGSLAQAAGTTGGVTEGVDGLAGAGQLGDALPSTQVGTGMVDGLPAGLPSGQAGITSLLNDPAKLADFLNKGGKLSDLLNAGAAGVSGALASAGDTQYKNALLGLTANAQNIQGNSAFENQLMDRAALEQKQRKGDLSNIYRESLVENPRVSPFNPAGAPTYSDAYKQALHNLSTQGQQDVATPAQYTTAAMPKLKPYDPYNPNTISGPGGTQPSTLQQIGNWAAPTLSTIGAISKLFGK